MSDALDQLAASYANDAMEATGDAGEAAEVLFQAATAILLSYMPAHAAMEALRVWIDQTDEAGANDQPGRDLLQ
jgi:hypothetical protein